MHKTNQSSRFRPSIYFVGAGIGTSNPFSVTETIRAHNLEVAQELQRRTAAIPGIVDVEPGHPWHGRSVGRDFFPAIDGGQSSTRHGLYCLRTSIYL